LIDDIEGDMLIGRSYADAPEIDGTVQVYTDKQVSVGDLIRVEIEEAGEYDLTGSQV
jgi:ribosomal protein S12 methylthiotransferase